jgi:hypothetical protein
LRLIALVCILMMPLQFKGGATEAHPHAFFQFWSDAESAPHHHGDRNDIDAGEYRHDGHAHDGGFVFVPSQSAADPTGDEPSSSTTVAPPGMTGAGQVAGFAMAFFLAMVAVASGRLRGRQGDHELRTGRVVTPPVPPPRASLGRFVAPAR